MIIELENKRGEMVSFDVELNKVCRSFYFKLFVGGDFEDGKEEDKRLFLCNLKDKSQKR
jgi:hypothetical protein